MSSRPPFLYKYRSISNQSDLAKDNALDALFKSYAVFTSRKSFNDLFDSKIEFIKPSARQIKALRDKVDKKFYKTLNTYIRNGKITPEGDSHIQDIEAAMNKMIDGYIFLCMTCPQ